MTNTLSACGAAPPAQNGYKDAAREGQKIMKFFKEKKNIII
jgi:hypothetical protein